MSQDLNPNSVSRIIVRMPNWLGDCVMATSALENLLEIYKNAEIVLVGNNVLELFERDCRFVCIRDESRSAKSRIHSLYKLAKRVGKADLAFSFTNSLYSALFLFWTKTPIRVGYARRASGIFLSNTFKTPNMHYVQRYKFIIKDFVDSRIYEHFMPLSICVGNKSLVQRQSAKTYVGISPGAAFGSAKCWEKIYFEELIKRFLAKDFIVCIFGNEQILELENNENLINLVNKTSLCELVDTMQEMDIFITNDSGPAHIVAALNKKLLAIFGPTDMRLSIPWNEKIVQDFFTIENAYEKLSNRKKIDANNIFIISRHLPCAPCHKRICPLKHHKCMKEISVDEVFALSLELLEK